MGRAMTVAIPSTRLLPISSSQMSSPPTSSTANTTPPVGSHGILFTNGLEHTLTNSNDSSNTLEYADARDFARSNFLHSLSSMSIPVAEQSGNLLQSWSMANGVVGNSQQVNHLHSPQSFHSQQSVLLSPIDLGSEESFPFTGTLGSRASSVTTVSPTSETKTPRKRATPKKKAAKTQSLAPSPYSKSVSDRDSQSPTAEPSSTTAKPAKKPGQPPRPPNAWILYRRDALKTLRKENNDLRMPQAKISTLLAQRWKNEDAAVRKEYEQRADVAKAHHHFLHPGYRYKPNKTGSGSDSEKSKDQMKKRAKKTQSSNSSLSPAENVPGSPMSPAIKDEVSSIPSFSNPASPTFFVKSIEAQNALEALENGFTSIAQRYGFDMDVPLRESSDYTGHSHSLPATPLPMGDDMQTPNTESSMDSYGDQDFGIFAGHDGSTLSSHQDYFTLPYRSRSTVVDSPTDSYASEFEGENHSGNYPMPFPMGSFDSVDLGLAPTSAPNSFVEDNFSLMHISNSYPRHGNHANGWREQQHHSHHSSEPMSSSIFSELVNFQGTLSPHSPQMLHRQATSTSPSASLRNGIQYLNLDSLAPRGYEQADTSAQRYEEADTSAHRYEQADTSAHRYEHTHLLSQPFQHPSSNAEHLQEEMTIQPSEQVSIHSPEQVSSPISADEASRRFVAMWET